MSSHHVCPPNRPCPNQKSANNVPIMGDVPNKSSKVVEITTIEEKKPQSRKESSQGDVEDVDTGESIASFSSIVLINYILIIFWVQCGRPVRTGTLIH